jgi:hypothetical protein
LASSNRTDDTAPNLLNQLSMRHHDTRHEDFQPNDILPNDTQHNNKRDTEQQQAYYA